MKTETQTAHTPGIWKVSKSPRNGYNVHDSSQNWIARINDLGDGEANARLIATAPELLMLNKLWLEFLNDHPMIEKYNSDIKELKIETKTAIAKAENQ